VSGCLKIAEPFHFMSDLMGYDIIPSAWIPYVAGLLPWIEIVVGLALLTGTFLGGGVLVSLFLMFGFIFFQASALIRGLDVTCGCFGTSSLSDSVSGWTLARTLGLAALIIPILLWAWGTNEARRS
ncbi:MAG: MauE/DoxX family redox-associated membrane protein, partial [Phycisphaerales bacterium JB063]